MPVFGAVETATHSTDTFIVVSGLFGGLALFLMGMDQLTRALRLAREVEKHQVERLVVDEPNRIATYGFEIDLITHLNRIFHFTRRTARVAVPVDRRPED